jgi:hypothetical protein
VQVRPLGDGLDDQPSDRTTQGGVQVRGEAALWFDAELEHAPSPLSRVAVAYGSLTFQRSSCLACRSPPSGLLRTRYTMGTRERAVQVWLVTVVSEQTESVEARGTARRAPSDGPPRTARRLR